MSSCNSRPPWIPPAGNSTRLRVYNSLTSRLEIFSPQNKHTITWYACGPTVYSSAHLGHARTYMTFDIIRRILEDYFGYNINYAMNVTDIDDKIILKARRNHLLNEFAANKNDLRKHSLADAFAFCENKTRNQIKNLETQLEMADRSQKAEISEVLKGEKSKLAAFAKLSYKVTKGGDYSQKQKDVLAEHLDFLYGHNLTDQSIFQAHSKKYEAEFWEDLCSLDIQMPNCITRVTEFIPEIIEFIRGIMDNSFAYESNGSVYFDTTAFRASGHSYPKLRPKQFGNKVLLDEAEGVLTAEHSSSEKRNGADFALWKRSKFGEPFWESPWGKGRPGWHIECSVMACKTLGKRFDIHSGGEDLCFPHHDNEIAQAEAHYHKEGVRQWVNYFLHAGHLGIDGLKMAKSLKNFVTIRQALAENTARQIRICFLLQGWNKKMDFSTTSLEEAVSKEKTLLEFIATAESFMRDAPPIIESPQKWDLNDAKMYAEMTKAQNEVHDSFCDNFNYPKVMHILYELLRKTNKYLTNSSALPKRLLVQKSTDLIKKVFRILGVLEDASSCTSSIKKGDRHENFVPAVLNAFCEMRDKIRAECLFHIKSESIGSESHNQIKKAEQQYIRAIASHCETDSSKETMTDTEVHKKVIRIATETNDMVKNDNGKQIVLECERFRERMARDSHPEASPKLLLSIADGIRLEKFPELGVKIEDSAKDGKCASKWKRMDSSVLITARDETLSAEKTKRTAKVIKAPNFSCETASKSPNESIESCF